MNKRLKLSCLSLFLALVICSCSSQKKYSYETVPNDPLKARIYTLDNGLKVYLTVNKETPRIQTFIAVRVGGKNDPAETTGLAHYFEHLMFKGTDKFGTKDYATEKPLAAVVMSLVVCAFAVLLCVVLFAAALLMAGGKVFVRGILAVPFSISGSAMLTGSGLLAVGAGILGVLLSIYLCKWSSMLIAKLVRRITGRKRG